MVRRIIIILIVFLSFSCAHETIYGKKRFTINIERIKQNKDFEVFKIIDTTKIYEITSAVYLPDNKGLNSVKKRYLKFYEEGKMGVFYYYDCKDLNSLNPKMANVGYYNFINGKLTIQSYFKHPQGGGFIKEKLYKVSNDTLQFLTENILTTFKAIQLANEFLIYKADW